MVKTYKLLLHRFFELTILIKGIDGFLSVIASAILFFAPNAIIKIIPYLVRNELIEDPHDSISNFLLHFSQTILPSTQLFIPIYLAIHGIIKISIALALHGKNHKLYQIAEAVLIIFIGYQIYRFVHTRSVILLFAIAIDMAIILLARSDDKYFPHNKS